MQHPGMALTTTVSSAPQRPGGREGGMERREEKEREEGQETVPQRTGHETSQIHSYQQVRVTICMLVLEVQDLRIHILFIFTFIIN